MRDDRGAGALELVLIVLAILAAIYLLSIIVR